MHYYLQNVWCSILETSGGPVTVNDVGGTEKSRIFFV